jgi:hypothetical protein
MFLFSACHPGLAPGSGPSMQNEEVVRAILRMGCRIPAQGRDDKSGKSLIPPLTSRVAALNLFAFLL